MDVLAEMADGGHEEVVCFTDVATGLRGVVAIHSTVLGPAIGGTRFRPYGSTASAVADALRLSRAMTYKAACAGLDQGGGKAVIVGDPRTDRTDELVRAYARRVDRLGGRYLTAEDVGTTQADMDLIREVTPHVTGTSESLGGSGDPSSATAVGVVHAMRAALAHLDGSEDLTGRRVVVSGAGKVGGALTRHLAGAGADVAVADVVPEVAAALRAELGVAVVDPADAHRIPCDVFSPCALGGVLDGRTIPELRCRAVVGSANNQLADEADADALAAGGIVYVPDFVANAGGIVNIAQERHPAGYDRARADAALVRVGRTTREVLTEAATQGTTPLRAAVAIAERRLAAGRADASATPRTGTRGQAPSRAR